MTSATGSPHTRRPASDWSDPITARDRRRTPVVGYLVKMFPRFSETFILAEILELQRQGVPLRIFSLNQPRDPLSHADVAKVQAPTTYVPRPTMLPPPAALLRAHIRLLRGQPSRYVRCLWTAARGRRLATLKHFAQAGYIAEAAQREEIQHFHAHFASSAASVALHVHRLTGIGYSVTAHAKDLYLDSVTAADLRRKLQPARFVVTVSDYNVRYLRSVGVDGRVVRIYNGLDLERFVPNGRHRDEPPLILAVGRLVEKKGFDILVRACSLLRDAGIPFRCQIVGSGEREAQLAELIEQLGLGGAVALAGALTREELLELYPRAAVVVAPCVVGADGNRDGLPTVLIEAMALGVPVVATDVTGIPELVEDGRTGFIVPQRDPAALARAIRRTLVDGATAQARVAVGLERVRRDFNVRVNVARLRTLFEAASAA